MQASDSPAVQARNSQAVEALQMNCATAFVTASALLINHDVRTSCSGEAVRYRGNLALI